MMFKKGSFEIGATIYPVAIKVTTLLCNQVILLKVNVFIAHLLIIELTLCFMCQCVKLIISCSMIHGLQMHFGIAAKRILLHTFYLC